MLFILTVLHRLFSRFNYNTNIRGVLDLDILLPITSTGTIDFAYMQDYITALEKLNIKDVVAYKDKVITAAKQIVSQQS